MIKDSFLALSLTQSLAEKAIDSITLGGKREIRNALELFHTFFNQLEMEYVPFSKSKFIASFGKSYECFIKELCKNVTKEHLKHAIVSIIYEMYLRGNELNTKGDLWIRKMEYGNQAEVSLYNSRGIVAFYIRLKDFNTLDIFNLVKNNPKSIFVIHIEEQRDLDKLGFECVNSSYLLSDVAYKRYKDIMHKEKLLFGVLREALNRSFNDELLYIDDLNKHKATFLAYYNKEGRIDMPIYNELYRARKRLDFNLAFLNLNGLVKNIQKKLTEAK